MTEVVNLKPHLVLAATSKKIKKEKQRKFGQSAIDKLAELNATSHRLLFIQEQVNKNPTLAILDPMQWYLEELLKEGKTPIEAIMYRWAEILLDLVSEQIATKIKNSNPKEEE